MQVWGGGGSLGVLLRTESGEGRSSLGIGDDQCGLTATP